MAMRQWGRIFVLNSARGPVRQPSSSLRCSRTRNGSQLGSCSPLRSSDEPLSLPSLASGSCQAAILILASPRKTIRNNIMCQSLFVGIHMRVSGLASATSALSGTKLCLRCRSPVAKYRRHSHGPRPAYGLPAARRRQFTVQEKKVDKGAEMEFNRVEVSDG